MYASLAKAGSLVRREVTVNNDKGLVKGLVKELVNISVQDRPAKQSYLLIGTFGDGGSEG